MKKIHLLVCFITISIFISAQNVGVGTTTPAEKLHVAGNIKADTIKPNAIKLMPNAGAGKLLISDAEGNASWQSMISSGNNSGNVGFGVWGDCATNGNISGYNPVAADDGATNDEFGYSVSISGSFAIVGAPFDDEVTGTNQGSASIYQFDGNNWVFMQKIIDPNGAANDESGYSVSISGNYAIVGAPFDDNPGSNSGSVSIYQFDGNSWVLMEQITDATGASSDHFGYSVCISGNYAVVGANADDIGANTDQGSVSIYQYDGTNWVLMEKITDATGAVGDLFGSSVSISGNYVIAGAFQDDVANNPDQGSASIYEYDGTNWILMQKIIDATGTASDNFGFSVSISDGYAAIGAWKDDVGANPDQGSASIYQYNGSAWVLMQKITETTGATSDFFGCAVAISAGYAIVGSYLDDLPANNNQGSSFIYRRVGNNWQRLQNVAEPSENTPDGFGWSTAIDGLTKRFLIGALDYNGGRGKAVFGKIN